MKRLGRILVGAALAAVCTSGFQAQRAFAVDGVPVIGGGLSAAVPVGKFKDSANLGGAADVYGGMHWQLNETVGIAWLMNPEFAFMPTDNPVNPNSGRKSDSDVIVLAAPGTGPRLTIGDAEASVFIDGRAAYFKDLSGPMNSSGVGYKVGGGASFELAKNTSLTLFGRFQEAVGMRAARGSSSNLRLVTAGLGLEHRFTPPPPPAAVPPPPPPPPPAPPMKKKIILRGVNFDFDKSNIRADARPVLDEAISTLKDAGEIRVAVGGHTDSRGSEAYNQGLSVRRANSVATYLEDGGISRSRLEINGYGESQPVASNDTEDGRAQNRRVELSIIP